MELKQDNLLFIGLGKDNVTIKKCNLKPDPILFLPLNFQAGSGHNGNNENTIEETQKNTAVRKIALRDYSVRRKGLKKT